VKTRIASFFLALIVSTMPLAADTFDFTYDMLLKVSPYNDFLPDIGRGTITATAQGNDTYLVTAISGVSSLLGAINGLAPADVDPRVHNDNLLFYPSTPYLSGNGIAFYAGRDVFPTDLYFASGAYQETQDGDPRFFGYGSGTFSITRVGAVPEPAPPAGWALLAGLATCLVRRRRQRFRYRHALVRKSCAS
jgi:hypothetical protein